MKDGHAMQSSATPLTPAQAHALADYVNANDTLCRADPLVIPMGKLAEPLCLVVLTDRRNGGNPPALRSFADYREHMDDGSYPPDALAAYEAWLKTAA